MDLNSLLPTAVDHGAGDVDLGLRGRFAGSGGFTLTEMIVVMAILGVIVAGLTQLFLSGSKAEADMSNRFSAQQNARLALDGLRREIHCASDVTVSGTPPWNAIKITLGSYCPTAGGATTVTWCTKDKNGHAPPAPDAHPYTLWRYEGASCPDTGGVGRPVAGDLTTPTTPPINPTFSYTPPAGGNLGTLSVDLPVDLTPSDAKQRYELKDDIVLRNTRLP